MLRALHTATRKTFGVDAALPPVSKHAINFPRVNRVGISKLETMRYGRRIKRPLIHHFSSAGRKKRNYRSACGQQNSSMNSRIARRARGRNNESHSSVIIFAPGEKFFRRVALSKTENSGDALFFFVIRRNARSRIYILSNILSGFISFRATIECNAPFE